jgi:UDP-glucose 4-epimerase
MRVVVTGAAGFIGSTLVDGLLGDGHTVLAVDNLASGHMENLADAVHSPYLTFLESDVVSPIARRTMASTCADVFFHLAADMDVRHSVADPIGNAHNNVLGLLAVLESARVSQARKVVFASSGGTIYGDQTTFPINESAPVDPHSPYAASKICGETYLATYRQLCRLQTTALALGNVYGPRQDPYGEAGVVSIFASALLEGRPTTIYGDGSSTRDYVHVDDVVDAFVLAAGPAGNGMRLNIGTGRETSVRELHRLLTRALGRPDTPRFLPPRPGELDRVALDSTTAQRVLGWRARTVLEDGLERTVDWLRTRCHMRGVAAESATSMR